MKALSIRQPFASLIAAGKKTVELRTWYTHYRGPLLICAAKSATGLSPEERLAGGGEPEPERQRIFGVESCPHACGGEL
ncbi:MAG: ASCH domain-containing protein [Planctomyces sp.]|jgi:hypothetical protein